MTDPKDLELVENDGPSEAKDPKTFDWAKGPNLFV